MIQQKGLSPFLGTREWRKTRSSLIGFGVVVCAEAGDVSVQMTDATSHSCDLEHIIFLRGASGVIEQCKSSVTRNEEEGGGRGQEPSAVWL